MLALYDFELVWRLNKYFKLQSRKLHQPLLYQSKQFSCLIVLGVIWCGGADISSEMEMRPSRSGPSDITALSPPRDSRATTAFTEEQIRQCQNEILTNRVQAFSMDHQACSHIPLFFTPSGQSRPVEEVAKELVGYFLICRESNVVMRIVETEAYPEDELIYCYRFPDPPLDFMSPAGTLISYKFPFGIEVMFITAGADDSGDLVLIRACAAVHGNREIANRVKLEFPVNEFKLANMMSGPRNVAMALAPDLGSYCNLFIPSSGFYLAQKDPYPGIMLEGPRLLPKDTVNTKYSTMKGADSRFRFALDCAQSLVSSQKLCRLMRST